MTRSAHWFGLLLASGAAACSSTSSSGAPIVSNIMIEGAHQVSPSEIKKKLVTTETSWWPFAKLHRFDPVVWNTDVDRVRRYYRARGYYRARILGSQVVPKPKNRVELVVTVEENEPVHIGRIDVSGLHDLPANEQDRALHDLPLVTGDRLEERDWEAAKQQIIDQLHEDGYAEARLDARATLDLATNLATLQLAAEPGPRYRFGALQVDLPLPTTLPPGPVAEQARLALPEGATYSPEALEEAQRRILAMDVFASARVRAGAADRASGTVPVVVEARPAPFRTLRLGAGVGVDQVRDEARLIAEWRHRNFLGGLRRLKMRAIVGWAFIPDALSVGRNDQSVGARQGPIYRGTAEFEQPRFLARPSLRLRTLVESERTVEQAYTAIGGRGLFGVAWQPTASLTLFPTYALQGFYLSGPRAQGLRSAPLVLGCRSDPCFIALSYLEQLLTWDRRDSPLEPRKGHYLSLSLQEGGGPLGGDFNYLRLLHEARAYVSPGEDDRFTLAGRVRVGTLLTASGDPDASAVVTRFMSGGSQSMRGFGIRRLSPLLLAPPAPGTTTSSMVAFPIGGNGLLEGSVEARWRTSEHLEAALFLDFGTVTRRRLPIPRPRELLYAVGTGLRYLSVIGPIRLDFAFRLPIGRPPPLYDLDGREITYERLPDGGTVPGSETGNHVNDSCFGIDGSGRSTWVSDGLCAIHISIGEAF